MAGVAQSVERQIVALEVASSKLVARPTHFIVGVSPSGKARDFDSRIRRFKSCHPSQKNRWTPTKTILTNSQVRLPPQPEKPLDTDENDFD